MAVAFYTIGTVVTPIPDEAVLIAAVAKHGYEIVKVGRGSYHIFKDDKRPTGQTEDDAARLILAEAKILPAPSREVDPKTAANFLDFYRRDKYLINGVDVILDKSGLKHILEAVSKPV